jgi:hypothetical protein
MSSVNEDQLGGNLNLRCLTYSAGCSFFFFKSSGLSVPVVQVFGGRQYRLCSPHLMWNRDFTLEQVFLSKSRSQDFSQLEKKFLA